jgi:CTP:molybdopterin cytidylyltransferase MocA
VTVAAVILAPDHAAALGETDGEPALRRVVHSAWAGGALPIVVVTPEPLDELVAAVDGLPVQLVCPGIGVSPGIGWFGVGARAALERVAETTAALIWPLHRVWVDPETVTSLIETHGEDRATLLRPAYAAEMGFPALVPVAIVEQLTADPARHAAEAIAAFEAAGGAWREVDMGDPGIVHGMETPRELLPPYQGPPRS